MVPAGKRTVRILGTTAIMLLCLLAAWCAEPKWSQVAGWIACTCLIVWSTCLGFGYAGLFNLANGCYLATGAYIMTLVGASALPSWRLAAGGMTVFCFVTAMSYAFVRHDTKAPLAFIVAALAINALFRHVLINGPEVLGGSNGVFVWFGDRFAPGMSGRNFALALPVWIAALCALTVGGLSLAIPEKTWTTWVLIRDAPEVAASFGCEPRKWKLLALVLSGAGIGVAGAGLALLGGGVSPQICTSGVPVTAFGYVLLGGRTQPWCGMLLAAGSGVAGRVLEPFLPNSYRMIEAVVLLCAIAVLGRVKLQAAQ